MVSQGSLRVPRIIAHRGASFTYPENTVAAFDQALIDGCDGIELDLQMSRDGVPVVYHDRTLEKIGGGPRAVREVDWVELAALDAGAWRDASHAGLRVQTLDRVLDRYAARTRLLLEIKARPADKRAGLHIALADAVVARLQQRSRQAEMVLCFDLETLVRVTDQAPRVPTVLNLRAPSRMTPALFAAMRRVWALSIDVGTISGAIVEAAHDEGKPVLTYTCNTPNELARAVEAGADGIMSDRPGWLREEVATLRRSEG